MTAGEAQARTSQDSSAGAERANYELQVENYWHNGDGTVDVKFSVVHQQFNWATYLCWAEQDSLSMWETVCGENEIMWIGQDGQEGGDAWGWRGEQVDQGWLTNWRWYVWLDAVSLEGMGMDPIECGVTYDVKFHKGILSQSIEVLIECPTEEPEEPKECTECPYGGFYDGANCYLGGAPEGAQAFMNNGYYGYTTMGVDCAEGDINFRNWCGVAEIPPEVDPFVWQNGFYYDPFCE
jgi:hypothetical protein